MEGGRRNFRKIGSYYAYYLWIPQWLSSKESACNAGDRVGMDLISGSGRYPGVGNGTSLQYSCLENSMDGGARWATVHGFKKNRTHNWVTSLSLSLHFHIHKHVHICMLVKEYLEECEKENKNEKNSSKDNVFLS